MSASRKFTAEYEFICDACGEPVRAGEAAVAEFDTANGTCVMRHDVCPERDQEERTVPDPPKTVRRAEIRCRERPAPRRLPHHHTIIGN